MEALIQAVCVGVGGHGSDSTGFTLRTSVLVNSTGVFLL